MEKGTLVEFRNQGERRLGVVERPDGKNRWIVLDERGQSTSLAPRQFTYKVVGQTYKPSEIPDFLKQVQSYLDPSSLEVAWELLIEDSTSATPEEMANLLFSQAEPPQVMRLTGCYRMIKFILSKRVTVTNREVQMPLQSASTNWK